MFSFHLFRHRGYFERGLTHNAFSRRRTGGWCVVRLTPTAQVNLLRKIKCPGHHRGIFIFSGSLFQAGYRYSPITLHIYADMIRQIFRPRLWWLLVLTLAFYLTRGVSVHDGKIYSVTKTVSLEAYEAEKNKNRYDFIEYAAFGKFYDPNPYHVWQFIANACLVIGCLSVGKELFLRKGGPS